MWHSVISSTKSQMSLLYIYKMSWTTNVEFEKKKKKKLLLYIFHIYEPRKDLQLGLCKPVLEPTRPTGTNFPTPPLLSTDGADVGERNAQRVPTLMQCSNRSSKSGTEASSNRTNPCFKCLELWIRRRFTEILSLKKQKKKKKYKPINHRHHVACHRSSSSSLLCFALVLLRSAVHWSGLLLLL